MHLQTLIDAARDLTETVQSKEMRSTAELRPLLEMLLPPKQQAQSRKVHDFNKFVEVVVTHTSQLAQEVQGLKTELEQKFETDQKLADALS